LNLDPLVPNRVRVGVSLWGSEVLGQMHRGKRVGLSSGSSEFQEKMRLGGFCASVLPTCLSEAILMAVPLMRLSTEAAPHTIQR